MARPHRPFGRPTRHRIGDPPDHGTGDRRRGPTIELRPGAGPAHERHSADRRRQLSRPDDDLWASLADLADPYELVIGGEPAGACSIDDQRRVHAFCVDDRFADQAPTALGAVIATGVVAAVVATSDAAFLSLGLEAGAAAQTLALLYELRAEPTVEPIELRHATPGDHGAAVAFDVAATGAPPDFLDGFLAERIGAGELYLVTGPDGGIVATGECRADRWVPGWAHLGMVVGTDHRGRGLGSRLLRALVERSRALGLEPLCSTEPSNVAAQRAIGRAGFRSRHRVLQVDLAGGH